MGPQWIGLMGIATMVMLVLTTLTGLAAWKMPRLGIRIKHHAIAGVITILFALAHAGLVMYYD